MLYNIELIQLCKLQMLNIYNVLTILLIPKYITLLMIIIFRHKEIISRIFEHFAFSDRQRPAGALVWVHAEYANHL